VKSLDLLSSPSEKNLYFSLPLIRSVGLENTNPKFKHEMVDADIKTEIEVGNYTLSSTTYQNVVNNSTNEPPIQDKTPKTTFTCGKCQEKIPKNEWKKHLHFHNGLTWKEGVQPPINFTDLNKIGLILYRFMKENKLETLKCDGCSATRKSSVGLLGHLIKCSLNLGNVQCPKEACVHCNKKLYRANMKSHLTICSQKLENDVCVHCNKEILRTMMKTHQMNYCNKLKRSDVRRVM
jgi:hypothetical protein